MLMDALAMKIHHFQNISMHWGLFEMLSNYLAPKNIKCTNSIFGWHLKKPHLQEFKNHEFSLPKHP